MPHLLMERDSELNPHPNAFTSPFMITMRYQCPCTGKEVLQISTVFDLDQLDVDWEKRKINNEEAFHWTVKRMLRDMLTEIKQHTNQPLPHPKQADKQIR